jgi:hypothetical protein
MENETMKLITIEHINDAHAMQCIEAFNYYIVRQAGVMSFSDNEYDEHGEWRNGAGNYAQWTCLGDHHGDGEGNGDGLAFSEEYKEQWEASQELQYGDARRHAQLHDAFADVE